MAIQFGLRFQLPRKPQGSFTCRKSVTWDRRLYFPSEGRHAVDFWAWEIRWLRPGSNPRCWVPEARILTTRPPGWDLWTFIINCKQLCNLKIKWKIKIELAISNLFIAVCDAVVLADPNSCTTVSIHNWTHGHVCVFFSRWQIMLFPLILTISPESPCIMEIYCSV
jgi:hypothetical protein